MLASLGRRLGLDWPATEYALRMAFAAGLAFTIAAALHVQNAVWAAIPVWVVAESTRGLLLERGLFRILGTLIGAAAGFGALHLFDGAYLHLVLLSAWIFLCSTLTHILRGLFAYGALMAGITAVIVVIPSILAANSSLDLAVARVECTMIGVVVVTLVTGLFTPETRPQAFYRRVRRLAGEAVAYAAEAVASDADAPQSQNQQAAQRVLAEIDEIEMEAGLVSAGSVEGHRRLRHVDAVVAAALAVMAAGRSIQMRRKRGATGFDGLSDRLRRLAEKLRTPAPESEPGPDGRQVVGDAPDCARLSRALNRLTSAETALCRQSDKADATSFSAKLVYLAPNRDWRLGLRTGLVSAGAAFATSAAAYAMRWPAGELSALIVCIHSMLLGSMPTPQEKAPPIFIGVTIGILIGTFHRLAIQPWIATLPELVASLAPFLLLGGFARASPLVAEPALQANIFFLVASHAGMPAVGQPQVLSASVALIAGAAVVAAGFTLLPRRADVQAALAAETIRHDLVRLLERKTSYAADWQSRTTRQILRLMLHLGRAKPLGTKIPNGLFSALNLGHAIVALQNAALRPDLAPHTRWKIDETLSLLRNFADDPRGPAPDIEKQAESIAVPEVALAMRDAADALNGCVDLFRFAEANS